ncbi:MAG: hypothetical protein K0U98_26425 [Deltaproteobacteria bacterium]|nr:hypothetical protein [Deltaproteobacteria bacterium]
MKRLRNFAILISALLVTGAVFAETITLGERETLFSKILDEERTLSVYLPASYAGSQAAYPVVYVLDSGTRFLHTVGALEALANSGHIPALIVVGVHNTNRTRDLTPPWTQGNGPEDWPEGREQVITAGGGANTFLDFFEEELIPHVDKTYRTAPFRVLVGHSFGGLFAVNAFVTKPDLFGATLAISPSLWWDEGRSVEQAQELFEDSPELSGNLYLTLADEGGDMLEQFRNMTTLLQYRAPGALRWEAHLLDGEDHGSIPIPSVYSGFRFFFPRWRVPPFAQQEGLEAVDQHYTSLSNEYGYDISTPEGTINNLGYQALGTDEIERAIEIFQTNVDRFPSSANVYDSLGEAVEAAGRLEEALKLYQKAYEIGAEKSDRNLSAYEGHIDAVKSKLSDSK